MGRDRGSDCRTIESQEKGLTDPYAHSNISMIVDPLPVLHN